MAMRSLRSGSSLGFPFTLCIAIITLFTGACRGTSLSESKSLIRFLQVIDPDNLLKIELGASLSNQCSSMWMGIKCDDLLPNIREIRLDNLSLRGTIDAESLCSLPSLKVLSLTTNQLTGVIPELMSNCHSLTYLNLSCNMLHGSVPASLSKLKNLRSFDISKNNFVGPIPHFEQDIEFVFPESMGPRTANSSTILKREASYDKNTDTSEAKPIVDTNEWPITCITIVISVTIFSFIVLVIHKRTSRPATEKDSVEIKKQCSVRNLAIDREGDLEKGRGQPDLVFFCETHERFNRADLLQSEANLQGQNIYSSLYMVRMKDGAMFAVKRLKNFKISEEYFKHKITWIGNLKHSNILPLVAYHFSEDEMLLIYRYEQKGSLLSLLSSYAEGQIDFPWRQRLCIMRGIARGLDYIARESSKETTVHGNLKPSNIFLSEAEEPLIGEHGILSFMDQSKALLYSPCGYRAPERKLSKEGDIYSFGVILLELLTGKVVEMNGVNLPKWVQFMVREEWTGEVFDREVNSVGKQWAFPLLNVALKCVSLLPEHRPDISEVLEKIEHVANSQEDCSLSSPSSIESSQHESSLMSIVVVESAVFS